MIVLGVDPGTQRVGFGVVEAHGASLSFVEAGLLGAEKGEPHTLIPIKQHLDKVIAKYAPDVVAIEKLFFAKNQKTAIAVAQARGVILLAAEESGARVMEYAPTEVKAGLTGHGGADKTSVTKMVRLILKKSDLRLVDDACDALALAIVASSDPHIRAGSRGK